MPRRKFSAYSDAAEDAPDTVQMEVPSQVVATDVPRRANFEPGALCWWKGKACRIDGWAFLKVAVRPLRGGGFGMARAADLEPLTLPEDLETPGFLTDLRQISQDDWDRAAAIEAAVKTLLGRGRFSRAEEASAAASVGLSCRHFRRLRVRYARNPTLAELLKRVPGRRTGASLLPEATERVMRDVIERELKVSPDIAVDDVLELIKHACALAKTRQPGRSTVAKRLSRWRITRNLRRDIAVELDYRKRPVRGALKAAQPLDVVQIDHTVCDAIIIDPEYRQPIGRPVLTLAIDLHSRVIVGMLLSLEAPSALSVALCLAHAVFPKERWLKSLGISNGVWPGYGLPRSLHLDNGREFHGKALLRGCAIYGIGLQYRPPADPHVGGVIERVIGTLMGKVQLLPGATYSKVLKGRPRKAEQSACFTLEELYQYLANEVTLYHAREHRTLRMSPTDAWERGWALKGTKCYPPTPERAQPFLLHFLPFAERVITREGVELLGGLRYRSRALEEWIERKRKRIVRYDPRDLSRVYVELNDHRHLIVPLLNPEVAAFSLWEWREMKRHAKVPLNPMNARAMREARIDNRRMIAERAGSRAGLRLARRQARERAWAAAQVSNERASGRALSTSNGQLLDASALDCEVLE